MEQALTAAGSVQGQAKKKKKVFRIAAGIAAALLLLAAAGAFYCSTVGTWHKIRFSYGADWIEVNGELAEEANQTFRKALDTAEVSLAGGQEGASFGGAFFLADWKPVSCQGNQVQIGMAHYRLTEEGEAQVAQVLERLAAYCQEQTEEK